MPWPTVAVFLAIPPAHHKDDSSEQNSSEDEDKGEDE
jgi:hypothetical protein